MGSISEDAMTVWSLDSVVWIPDDIMGAPALKQITLDLTRTTPHLSYDFCSDSPVETMLEGNFPSPDVLTRLHVKAAEQRKVAIITRVIAGDSRDAMFAATGGTERLLDWISFLLLDRVFALSYGTVSGRQGNKLTMGFRPSFEERSGQRGMVRMSSYRPPRTLNLHTQLRRFPNGSLASALAWYRKGLSALTPEDQFVNWWTGLEILSEALKTEGVKEIECPHCEEFLSIPEVANSALRQHMESNLHLHKRVFHRLHGIRSGIIHGSKLLDEPYRGKLACILPGLSTLFLTMALRVLNNDEQQEDVPAWYYHPVRASIEDMASTLLDLSK